MRLPRGVGAVTREVRNGKPGIIEHVRRWGVTLRGGILEDTGFDPTPLLSRDRTRFASDDAEALHLITLMTHYDLPGFFVIASEEHPFLLFDPEGTLKGQLYAVVYSTRARWRISSATAKCRPALV